MHLGKINPADKIVRMACPGVKTLPIQRPTASPGIRASHIRQIHAAWRNRQCWEMGQGRCQIVERTRSQASWQLQSLPSTRTQTAVPKGIQDGTRPPRDRRPRVTANGRMACPGYPLSDHKARLRHRLPVSGRIVTGGSLGSGSYRVT